MVNRLHIARAKAWLIPLVYAVAAVTLGVTISRLAHILLPKLASTISVNAAIGIYSSVASGMLSLTGIVFSLTFVMVQFSATAYSPRLVLWIARDPVMSHAIGVFTATFLYALVALAWVDRSGSGRVPLVSVGVVTALLVISIIMFISVIQRVGMLQVTQMLVFTGDQGRAIIDDLYPPMEISASPSSGEICHGPSIQTLVHRGRPQIVQAVNVSALIDIASRAGCTIELTAAVGDAVLDSIPILRVHGGVGPLPESQLRRGVHLGVDRTFEQDPKYAIRLLVDIAIKALSAAINDPTNHCGAGS